MSEDVVRKVRDKLFPARIGKPLNNPEEFETGLAKERAYHIVTHVAYQLARTDPTIGVIRAKRGSVNNFNGINCDVIARANGEHWDILINKFGNAYPSWGHHDANDDIASRWERSPVDWDLFGGIAIPNPEPNPEPPKDEPKEPDVSELIQIILEPLLARLDSLEDSLNRLEVIATQIQTQGIRIRFR